MRAHACIFLTALLVTMTTAGQGIAAGPQAWTVDKAHSKLGFDSAYGDMKFSGGFNAWTADIKFDPANLTASKAVVTIDLASAQTGDGDRDQSLPAADWFNTMKFPRATFTTSAIKSLGGDKYQAQGLLNLKGLVKPLTLNFTLNINGKQATMRGQAVMDRTQWGVGQGQFQDEKPVPHVVTVNVNITANKA